MHGHIHKYCGRTGLVLLALISLLALPYVANSAPANKLAVAVIIGNTNYHGRIPSVDFAGNDAEAFKKFVIDVQGYDPENIIDLRDATQAQLLTTFGNYQTPEGKLWRYLDPKGRSDVTVFYSGHGVPGLKDKRGYLLPVDADAETPEINGFSVDTLLANLSKLKTKSVTVFLDACFSGESQKGMLVKGTSGINITPKMPSSSSGLSVITAAQGDQVASWDDKAKHGLFTKHLLDALYGGADDAEYGNGDGKVAFGELGEYLDDRLTRAARRQFGRHQNAWFSGDKERIFVNALPSDHMVPTIIFQKPKGIDVASTKIVVDKNHAFDGRWQAEFQAACSVIAPDFEVQNNKFTWSITGMGYTINYENTINSDGSFLWTSSGYIPTFMEGNMEIESGTGESTFNGGGECNGKVIYTKLN
jgi:hypothetical protein